jgi:predicted DNA-binding ribbon-helix-helix protein
MKKRRCVCIEDKFWKKLQELAKKENRSASNYIEYLIEKISLEG